MVNEDEKSPTGAPSVLNAGLRVDSSHVIAEYKYPYNILPEYHTALYQLLVGVEQRHPQENLDAYAKNLRRLAESAFVSITPNDDVLDGMVNEGTGL